MKVATYHRVSTLDQNPKLPRAELRAAARRLGRVVLEREETASGMKTDRPALAEVMAAARAGEVDAIIVWKLDRFGRSALDLLANVRELERLGVRFIASTQGIDIGPGAGALGKLQLTMLAAVAEFERELIVERTRLGIAHARKHGTKSGKAIGRPRAEMSPPMVAAAAEWYRRLRSWRKVARRLRADGFANIPSHATIARVTRGRTKPPPRFSASRPR